MRYAMLTRLSLLATSLLPSAAAGTTATPSCACTSTLLATPLPTSIGPRITVEPATLTLECSGSFTVSISNPGSAGTTLVINRLDIANGYEQGYYGLGFSWDASAIQLPASLPSGATLQIPVTYNSAASFPSLLHVTIDSNATNFPHLFVTYFGRLCASPTPTPTYPIPGDLGYKGVDGFVYDAAVGPGLPIAGAQVDYTHSSLVNPGGRGTAITDAQGRFGLFLFLHDTDTIVVHAQASGFRPHDVEFSGLQLWYDVQRVELGLEPELTHTVTATPTSTPTPGPTWSNVGPAGTNINALVIDPKSPATLYAAGGRIYKSTDGGASWHDANVGITSMGVAALAIDPLTPSTLYAGTPSNYARSNGGVFKSTDGGLSWHQMNGGPLGGPPGFTASVPALALDPNAPNTIYAGVSGGGSAAYNVAKSVDGALTWTFASTDLSDRQIYNLAIDPGTPATLYSATDNGVFRSTDGTASWQRASNGLAVNDVRSLAVAPAMPAMLLAGTIAGVSASDDGADNWHAATTGLSDSTGHPLVARTLAIDPLTSTTCFVGTAAGIFKTTDGGGLWTPSAYSDAAAIAIDPVTPTTLYAGGVGVLKSTDGGASWSDASAGLPGTSVTALAIDAVHPGTRYAATLSGVFKSIDGGVFWREVDDGLFGVPIFSLVVDPHNQEVVYAGTAVGVFRSTDGAATWLPSLGDPVNDSVSVAALVIASTTPTTLYADAVSGLFKSSDAGNSWSLLTSGLPGPQQLRAPVVDPTTPTIVYASGLLGVLKSTDGGLHWSTTGLPDGFPLAVDPTSSTTVYAIGVPSVSKSTDGGVSWHAADEGLPATVRVLTIDPSNADTLYVGTEGAGVFRSLDGGASWSPLGSELPSSVVQVVLDPVTPTTVYAATGLGLFAVQQAIPAEPPIPTSTSTSTPATSPTSTATPTRTPTATPIRTATATAPQTIIVEPTASTAETTNGSPVHSGGGCTVVASGPRGAADLIFLGLPVLLLRRSIRLVSNRSSKEGVR